MVLDTSLCRHFCKFWLLWASGQCFLVDNTTNSISQTNKMKIREGEAACSESGRLFWFYEAELVFLTVLITTYSFFYDNLMRGVNKWSHWIMAMSYHLRTVPCKPNLYLKLWTNFHLSTQHLPWIASMLLQVDKDKTNILRFTSKSATPIVFSISVNHPVIYPLAQAKVSSMRNPTEKYNKISVLLSSLPLLL